jgi:uncharacterized protein (DUF697 family)
MATSSQRTNAWNIIWEKRKTTGLSTGFTYLPFFEESYLPSIRKDMITEMLRAFGVSFSNDVATYIYDSVSSHIYKSNTRRVIGTLLKFTIIGTGVGSWVTSDDHADATEVLGRAVYRAVIKLLDSKKPTCITKFDLTSEILRSLDE